MVKTPGKVNEFVTKSDDARAKTEAEVDFVMEDHVCCTKYCLEKWKEHFGNVEARKIIRTERSAHAGMDHTQRRMYHMQRIKSNMTVVLKTPVLSEDKVRVGK